MSSKSPSPLELLAYGTVEMSFVGSVSGGTERCNDVDKVVPFWWGR